MTVHTKTTFETYNHIKTLLEQNKKVFYTRFGDGEIIAMMGKNHRNYQTSEGLVRELKESFRINHPQYLIGLAVNYPAENKMIKGVFAPFSFNEDLNLFLNKNDLYTNETYESFIFFHYLAVFYPKLMYNFFEKYIRPKTKMFIGSTPRHIAEKLYGKIDYYVNTPRQSAYDHIEDWWLQVEQNIDKVELVIPSAGAASNVISKRLWYKKLNINLFDIGSLVDAVDRKKSRGWIKRKGHKIQKILPPEHRDRSLSLKWQGIKGDFNYWYRRHIKYRNNNYSK